MILVMTHGPVTLGKDRILDRLSPLDVSNLRVEERSVSAALEIEG